MRRGMLGAILGALAILGPRDAMIARMTGPRPRYGRKKRFTWPGHPGVYANSRSIRRHKYGRTKIA